MSEPPRAVGAIERDHRYLDGLLGRTLSLLGSEDAALAARALEVFDGELRRHTAAEDEHLLQRPPGSKLGEIPGESEDDRLRRELALEHVQLRELSGMILRLLRESPDVAGARALFPKLLQRWEAHTSREESALAALMPKEKDFGELFLPGPGFS